MRKEYHGIFAEHQISYMKTEVCEPLKNCLCPRKCIDTWNAWAFHMSESNASGSYCTCLCSVKQITDETEEYDIYGIWGGVRMRPKSARKLRDILLIIGIMVMLLGYINEIFLVIGAIIACACLLPHFLFYRCPHCKRGLGRNEGEFCQYCGKRIDES